MENEIDDNLDELSSITANLKNLAMASGKEVDEQIKRIDRMDGKAGKLDNHINNVTRKASRISLTLPFPCADFGSSAVGQILIHPRIFGRSQADSFPLFV